jgi:flagellin
MKRLSSGLRINTASDDAAGLGIATRLQSQVTGIQAAVKNTQDGINFAQTADGSLGEVEQTLQAMRQLVVQGLNETNSISDREALQQELDQMKAGISSILSQSNYNEMGIFNGDFANMGFQIGKDSVSGLNISVNKLDLNQLGSRIVLLGTSGVDTAFSLTGGTDFFSINDVVIRDSNAADDQISTIDNANSAIAKAAAINSVIELTGVRATALATRTDTQETLDTDLGGGVFGNSGAIQEVTLTANTYLSINGVEFNNFTVKDVDADGALVDSINARFEDTGVYAELDSQGQLVLVAPDGRNLNVEYNDDGGGATLETLIGLNDGDGFAYGGQVMLETDDRLNINFGSDVNAVLGDLASDYNYTDEAIYAPNKEKALTSVDITTENGRIHALNTIDRALSQISDERSFFGALQNRFSQTVASLENEMVNLQTAKSNIQDADFGYESARLALNQIRLNASAAMLAQANIQPIMAYALIESN